MARKAQTTNMLIFLASAVMLLFFNALMGAFGMFGSTDWRVLSVIALVNVGIIGGLVIARIASTLGS